MNTHELQERLEKLTEEVAELREIVRHYESMSTGVKWFIGIITGSIAFVLSVKAIFAKLIIP